VSEAILQARTPDGNPLVGTPEVVRWLTQVSRNLRDVGAIVDTTGGGEAGKGIDERIAEINKWMGAPNGSAEYKQYWSNAAVQKEYHDLLARKEAMQRRAAA
ncbi:MAG: hypothetical protein ACRETH_06215, partial [Steroidobacteraceae bacterium]